MASMDQSGRGGENYEKSSTTKNGDFDEFDCEFDTDDEPSASVLPRGQHHDDSRNGRMTSSTKKSKMFSSAATDDNYRPFLHSAAVDKASTAGGGYEKQPAPTGTLAWIGFWLSLFALACLCLSFCSPYWWQTWPKSENEFKNIGLWHVCFDHYMHFKDDSQEVYSGCWWMLDRQPKYYKMREWLMPPWFISCQVLVTGCLLIEIATVFSTMLIFLHCCPLMNHEYIQTYGMFASASMMFLVAMISLAVGVLFGVQVNDRYWLPRPDLNFLSWGFGFLVISGIVTLASGMCMFKAAWDTYQTLLYKEDEYTKMALEMSAFPTDDVQTIVCPPAAPDHPVYSAVARHGSSYAAPSSSVYPGAPPSYSVYAPGTVAATSYSDQPLDEKDTGDFGPSWRASATADVNDSVFGRPESDVFGPRYGLAAEPAGPYVHAMRAEPETGLGVPMFGKSYDRYASDTSFADPELEEFGLKPERQY